MNIILDGKRGDVRVVQQESVRDRAPRHWWRRLPQGVLPLHALQENSEVPFSLYWLPSVTLFSVLSGAYTGDNTK